MDMVRPARHCVRCGEAEHRGRVARATDLRLSSRHVRGACYRFLLLAGLLWASPPSLLAADSPLSPGMLEIRHQHAATFDQQNVALWTGLARGTFLKHGVAVDLQFTQTSPELRDGLASGAVDVAHAAADNAIAMVEVSKQDVVIVMGGDSSMNEFFVQPDVATLAGMRGRTLTVDAPNTAYALQGMKILKNAGVMPGEYQVKVTGGTFQRGKAMMESKENAASTLNPPYSFEAAAAELRKGLTFSAAMAKFRRI